MTIAAEVQPAPLYSDEAVGEIALLRAIDRGILEIRDDTPVKDLEQLFIVSLAEFCRLYRFRTSTILVFMGSEFRPLRRSGLARGRRVVPLTPTLASFIDMASDQGSRLVERGDDPQLFAALPTSPACLVAPVQTPGGHLLCVLIVAAASEKQACALRQPHVADALNALRSQLTIAYRQFERARQHFEMRSLWAEFLDRNLAPTVCFRSLAKRIPRFLPTFGPLGAIDPNPSTQILILSDSPDEAESNHLIIRGTTGAEHSGTRVDVRRSISGLLITDPERPLFCGDPTAKEYRRLYKNYFGDPKHRARTELAVRIRAGGEVIGVVNLESKRKDAFAYLHQQTLLELAGTFGRLAGVLEQRLMMNTAMQNSVATSTQNYLNALAHTFLHGLAGPQAAQQMDDGSLAALITKATGLVAKLHADAAGKTRQRTRLDRLDEMLEGIAERQQALAAARHQVIRYSTDFSNDIAGYAKVGRIVLREIVDAGMQLAVNSLIVRTRSDRLIEISVTQDESLPDTWIFCSTLIKQHLYNIFHNSVDAIKKRLENDDRPGRITVSILPEEIPEGQEQRLNKAWVVRIRDNGGGATAGQLAALKRFDPGITFKAGGHGYGLTAAQRYVASIGGRMELASTAGRFFEVALYLDEYNFAVHGNRETLSTKGGFYG